VIFSDGEMTEESNEPSAGSFRPLAIFAWVAFAVALFLLVAPPAGTAMPLAFAAAGLCIASLDLATAEEIGCLGALAVWLNAVLLGLLLMLSFAFAVI
jgi:hypothetical protein